MSSVLFDPALVRSVISWLFLDHQQSHIIGFTQFSLPHLGLRCLAAVFGLSSTFLLYHFHLFNWAELGWAQLKLSWAGPTRSDCYSAAGSADIFCLKSSFFQHSSARFNSHCPTQLSWAWLAPQGLTTECWSAHIFFFSIQYFSIQLSSSHLFQLNSAEADFSWPHKVWLRSADQLTPHSSFTTQAFFFSTQFAFLKFMQKKCT